MQRSAGSSVVGGAGQGLLSASQPITDVDFHGQYQEAYCKVHAVGGEWKGSLRLKFPVCARCIMFVIYNQPWEVDVPRLRLQMRRQSVGCTADVVVWVPQPREGRAVNETDM